MIVRKKKKSPWDRLSVLQKFVVTIPVALVAIGATYGLELKLANELKFEESDLLPLRTLCSFLLLLALGNSLSFLVNPEGYVTDDDADKITDPESYFDKEKDDV